MAYKSVEIRVTDEMVGRVDKVVQSLTGHSRSELRGLFDHQCVAVNGQECTDAGAKLKPGDLVAVHFDPHTRYREKKDRWADRTFSIVFEDDDLIVVDKSSGVLTVPTDDGEKNTLIERVNVYLSHSRRRRDAWVVHRLDRDVSGLLVLAKNEAAYEELVEQFKIHQPERFYQAIVHGQMRPGVDVVRNYLQTAKNLDRFATRDEKRGELAITHYDVIRVYDDTSLVNVWLETGRRNQIRVHFADLGHPILGDTRYGRHTKPHPHWTSQRIALHAGSLAFRHPRTGEPLQFQSALPPVMERFKRRAEATSTRRPD